MLDLAGRRRRKQGFNSPRIQVTDNEVLTEITYKKRDNMSSSAIIRSGFLGWVGANHVRAAE